jgi:hypothetical protein
VSTSVLLRADRDIGVKCIKIERFGNGEWFKNLVVTDADSNNKLAPALLIIQSVNEVCFSQPLLMATGDSKKLNIAIDVGVTASAMNQDFSFSVVGVNAFDSNGFSAPSLIVGKGNTMKIVGSTTSPTEVEG